MNFHDQVLSMSPTQGNIITFTVIPDQDAMREHIEENCENHGWEDEETIDTQEFDKWLEEKMVEHTEANTRFYATVVPDDVSFDGLDWDAFDKYLEKGYEEDTGWLRELHEGFGEKAKDGDEVTILQHDDELWWGDMELGVITHKCNLDK